MGFISHGQWRLIDQHLSSSRGENEGIVRHSLQGSPVQYQPETTAKLRFNDRKIIAPPPPILCRRMGDPRCRIPTNGLIEPGNRSLICQQFAIAMRREISHTSSWSVEEEKNEVDRGVNLSSGLNVYYSSLPGGYTTRALPQCTQYTSNCNKIYACSDRY